MAALVAPGAPVSVLVDYGLGENVAAQLVESGVATIERLGSMTPEQLEEIPGIGPESVEQLRDAVNAYYSQFETDNAAPAQEAEPAASGEEPAEGGGADADAPEVVSTVEAPSELEIGEELLKSGPEPDEAQEETTEQFGTMEGAGSPTHNHPEGTGAPEEGRGE
jgi:N utilization substance protein A